MVSDVTKRLNHVVSRARRDLEANVLISRGSWKHTNIVSIHIVQTHKHSVLFEALQLKCSRGDLTSKRGNYSGAQCKHTDVLYKQRKGKRLGEETNDKNVEKRWRGQTGHASLHLSKGLNKLLMYCFIILSYKGFCKGKRRKREVPVESLENSWIFHNCTVFTVFLFK